MQRADIDHRFADHGTNDPASIREACRTLAHTVNDSIPDGREKSTAITKIEEAMFWANAGLARDKVDPLAT